MQDTEGIWLSQRHYIIAVLKRFVMSSCKAVSTPMGEGALKDIAESDSPATDRETYQEPLGCLLFLSTRTRPNITASVGILCSYSSNPQQVHLGCTKKNPSVPERNQRPRPQGFCSDEPVLKAYCEADLAGDRTDRKSSTGTLFQLGRASVAWRSLMQGAVALYTTEAEFVSLGEGTKMVIWLRNLLQEFGCEQTESTPVMEDNHGAVVWGSEGVRHAKHISIRKNFVPKICEVGSFPSSTTVQGVWWRTYSRSPWLGWHSSATVMALAFGGQTLDDTQEPRGGVELHYHNGSFVSYFD